MARFSWMVSMETFCIACCFKWNPLQLYFNLIWLTCIFYEFSTHRDNLNCLHNNKKLLVSSDVRTKFQKCYQKYWRIWSGVIFYKICFLIAYSVFWELCRLTSCTWKFKCLKCFLKSLNHDICRCLVKNWKILVWQSWKRLNYG
jgi:dolichol kinase